MNKDLVENNYVFIKNFITKEEALELSDKLKSFEARGNGGPDQQVPGSNSFYNFLPLVTLLVKKVNDASDVAGEQLLPTYVYARNYKKGAILRKHTDRDACEVSLTLNLQEDKKWPIWIQKPNGDEVSVTFEPGDAMMYLGCIAPHWREEFDGEFCSQAFLHYVRATGPRANCFFDK